MQRRRSRAAEPRATSLLSTLRISTLTIGSSEEDQEEQQQRRQVRPRLPRSAGARPGAAGAAAPARSGGEHRRAARREASPAGPRRYCAAQPLKRSFSGLDIVDPEVGDREQAGRQILRRGRQIGITAWDRPRRRPCWSGHRGCRAAGSFWCSGWLANTMGSSASPPPSCRRAARIDPAVDLVDEPGPDDLEVPVVGPVGGGRSGRYRPRS